jgi:acyl dehydratase
MEAVARRRAARLVGERINRQMPKADLSVIGRKRGPEVFEYTWKDTSFYALAVGAGARDLPYILETTPGGLKVLPSFAVVCASRVFPPVGDVQWSLFLHGEQALRVFNPFPPEGRLVQEGMVTAIHDKGKGALYQVEIAGSLEDGTPIYQGRWGIFYVGAGGFGGDPGPKAQSFPVPAGRPPDFSLTQRVADNQAALYRLCGDRNPLHIDPAAARVGGFDRPILHGLCTFGFTTRIFCDQVLAGDVARCQEISARFASPVYPGDDLTVEGWRGDQRWLLQARVQDRVVMSNAQALAEP